MANRTTDTEVRAILDDDSSISTAPFIEVANNLVTRVCTDSDYDDDTLELIERWLSAHFYTIRDQAVASEKAGSVAQSFQHKLGLNLQVTRYGQQAIMVDTAGNLLMLSMGKRRSVGITWLGTGNSTGDDIST